MAKKPKSQFENYHKKYLKDNGLVILYFNGNKSNVNVEVFKNRDCINENCDFINNLIKITDKILFKMFIVWAEFLSANKKI